MLTVTLLFGWFKYSVNAILLYYILKKEILIFVSYSRTYHWMFNGSLLQKGGQPNGDPH